MATLRHTTKPGIAEYRARKKRNFPEAAGAAVVLHFTLTNKKEKYST